jgi:short subunit dehydrogenase-like uncharacterized protein
MAERDLSLLILGARGVTGRQAVRWMRGRGAELGVRWAIAGRDPAALEALTAGWNADERPEILRVDLADRASVATAVERADVVVSFAGPFARLAPPVIEACVEAGNDYIDVSGEIDFVAEVVERWHEPAQRSGARIVQVAGFEALPFDLCAASAIERLGAEHGARPETIDAVFSSKPPPGVPRPSDLVSRGTFESLREAIAGEGAHRLGDPAALLGDLGDPDAVREASPIRSRPRWERGVGPLAPMTPSPVINPPVIQRSLALAGLDPVRYREAVATSSLAPTRPVQALVAGSVAAVAGGLALLARAPASVRGVGTAALGLLTPAGGPREDRLEGWRWRVECTVRGAAGATSRARVEAEGHPGYLTTGRMTTEAGLILADPRARTPTASGCLTPAAALGTAELERFASAGLEFS